MVLFVLCLLICEKMFGIALMVFILINYVVILCLTFSASVNIVFYVSFVNELNSSYQIQQPGNHKIIIEVILK